MRSVAWLSGVLLSKKHGARSTKIPPMVVLQRQNPGWGSCLAAARRNRQPFPFRRLPSQKPVSVGEIPRLTSFFPPEKLHIFIVIFLIFNIILINFVFFLSETTFRTDGLSGDNAEASLLWKIFERRYPQ
jgi:hypothetical protein